MFLTLKTLFVRLYTSHNIFSFETISIFFPLIRTYGYYGKYNNLGPIQNNISLMVSSLI